MQGSIATRVLRSLAAAWLAFTACSRGGDVPSGGELSYRRYCASCHGVTGRGDGPAAAALSPPPKDLTRSKLDLPELMRWIDGSRTVRAHGSAAMPVWGEVFDEELAGEPHRRYTALLKVRSLADYVYRLRE